ncbi:MAG: hypothetical protein LBD74_08055 [Spirochaetaceae bacterium]|jgi:hypothetical protein|nr:hypothetical protein [Spirochaetaceae bacterium]
MHTKPLANRRKALILGLCLAGSALLWGSCDLYRYGELEGADRTLVYYPGDDLFEDTLSALSGVWYSHYAGMGRLDGYRIGKWKDFEKLVLQSKKGEFFPALASPYQTYTRATFAADDYFVLYDDTVFGENDEGIGGNGGWEGLITRYIGIVRGLNVFNGDPERGVVLIEYLEGCAPQWDAEVKAGKRPFFGMYYRFLGQDLVQMANAVNLENLYAGKPYATETKTLQEAVERNTVENEAEFISWGVVIPCEREH